MSNYKTLVKKLDRIFSRFVRLRDKGMCITCGKISDIKSMDAGHYIGRAKLITRWNEENVHCQCTYCNKYLSGNLITYREKLIELYGEEKVKYLESLRHKTIKYSTLQLECMINYFKERLSYMEDSNA